MNHIVIRDANPSHPPFLHQIVALFDQREDPAALRGWSPNQDVTLICEVDGQPVAAVWSRPHRVSGTREVYIGVVPDMRGNGVAGRLLTELISRTEADTAVDSLIARVNPTNERARRLFKSRGFSTQDEWAWTLPIN